MTYSVNFANYTIGKEAYKNVNEVCRLKWSTVYSSV